MPWCPQCRSEYREGYTHCYDCGVELIDYLASPARETKEEENLSSPPSFLTTAGTPVQVSIIESILLANQIPVWKKPRGAGEYLNVYAGMSVFGVDIYVPAELKEQAAEIIQALPAPEDPSTVVGGGGELRPAEEVYLRRRRQRTVLLFLVVHLSGLLAAALWAIIRNG